jgi:hypothetical protein
VGIHDPLTELRLTPVGERLELTGHDGRIHGLVETTRVTIAPLDDVGDDVARYEGEPVVVQCFRLIDAGR